jgi:drug/metabolite transporter (DMT)-like permease
MTISPRIRAILQALLVTFLWSTSWVFIKLYLGEIPPLIFAGLRYAIAFLILSPGLWKNKDHIRALSRTDWRRLIILGLVFYTMTQGGQFLALNYLNAVTFSLLLNFTSLLVAIIGILLLQEIPSAWQWGGIVVFIAGVLVYFLPNIERNGSVLGYSLAAFTVCANAAAVLLGRSVNKTDTIPPLVVTVISMGVGAVVLMVVGLATQGLPRISLSGWLVILWLAAVNTAFAFTLWNKSQRILRAVESSLINNTMLIQISVLAWLFLGERISFVDGVGLCLALIGVLIVKTTGKLKNS